MFLRVLNTNTEMKCIPMCIGTPKIHRCKLKVIILPAPPPYFPKFGRCKNKG